jgi:lysozyme family protein
MSFDASFFALIGNEGGYSNHVADPGGETMHGITKRVAVENGYTGEMRDLPLSKAKEIAKAKYWDKYHCDKLPPKVAFQVFDAAYNGGYPVKWLQQAAKVRVDGIIGPATVRAVSEADPDKIIMRFDAYRLQYMAGLSSWTTFGRGWANRIAGNLISASEE